MKSHMTSMGHKSKRCVLVKVWPCKTFKSNVRSKQIYEDQRSASDCLGPEWEWRLAANGHERFSRGDGNMLRLDCGEDCTT